MMRKAVKYGIFAFAGMVLLADLVIAYPAVAMMGLYAVGRSGNCDATSALHSWDNIRLRAETIGRNMKLVKKLGEEGPLSLWQTPAGDYWVPTRDGKGFVPLISEQEMRVYEKVLPGEVVIDAGANIGDFTRAALEDGAKLVVAIEINPETILALRRNLAKEIEEGRVIVYTKGVWDSEGELALQAGAASGIDSLIPRADLHPSTMVKLTTIDKIAAELDLPPVDVIKLDVEGAEIRAVRGATEVIRRSRPRLAFDGEQFTADDISTLNRELQSLDPAYRMTPSVCIYFHAERRLRTDVVRYRAR